MLEVSEQPNEVVITIETTADAVGRSTCGVRAEAYDRMPMSIRDLTRFRSLARLVWRKRRWRCVDPDCGAKTWIEHSAHDEHRGRTGAAPWSTMRTASVRRNTSVSTRSRSWPRQPPSPHSLCHRPGRPAGQGGHRKVVTDTIGGKRAAWLRRWAATAHSGWLVGIEVVATNLDQSFPAGCPHISTKPGEWPIVLAGGGEPGPARGRVRRQVQNETLGHRAQGRPAVSHPQAATGRPRTTRRAGHQRVLLGLRVRDPADEVLGARLAKESVRDTYLGEVRPRRLC